MKLEIERGEKSGVKGEVVNLHLLASFTSGPIAIIFISILSPSFSIPLTIFPPFMSFLFFLCHSLMVGYHFFFPLEKSLKM